MRYTELHLKLGRYSIGKALIVDKKHTFFLDIRRYEIFSFDLLIPSGVGIKRLAARFRAN